MSGIGIVKTLFGSVEGEVQCAPYDDVTIFKGIPYAAPPVGKLRWMAPIDPEPWEGIRQARSYAPIEIQPTTGALDQEPWHSDFYYMGNPPQSEDCLYLNVTTAASSCEENRPVLMWFHGGGFDHGYSYEKEFDPCVLAQKGVIVVSVPQRLSAFGYMCLPQLDDEQDGKSGNYSLLDDIKALQWVIDNISAFGGDPNCITVGGQSAGTSKAMSLALTNIAQGHVLRVINQSGFAANRKNLTRNEAHDVWRKYLTEIGIDPHLSPDELRRIDPYCFLPKSPSIHIPGGYVYDGDLVPNINQSETIDRVCGRFDILAGINLGETHMKPNAAMGERGYTTASAAYSGIRDLIGDLYDKYDFENLVKITDENADRITRYLAAYGLKIQGSHPGGVYFNRAFAAKHKAKAPDKKFFNYIFARVSPGTNADKGTMRDPDVLMSWHSNELWYTFSSLRKGVPPCRNWSETDFELADTISSYFANFIKTGDANGNSLPFWPESGKSLGFVILGDKIEAFPEGQGELDALIGEYMTKSGILL